MLPSTVRSQIFASLPRPADTTVWIDYADRANISKALRDHDVAVTLRYFADRPDRGATPANKVFRREIDGDDVHYTKGERAQVTLSVQVHAADTPTLDAYLALLQVWYLRDLPTIVEVVGRSEIPDLSFIGERCSRQGVDIFLRYPITYDEVVPSIETISHDVTMEDH